MITVSNSGHGSKIVLSGTTVKPLDDNTDPRVVPTVSISYSHCPWLRMRTSANASFGPAISSNWKPGNNTIATVTLRICRSDEFGFGQAELDDLLSLLKRQRDRIAEGWVNPSEIATSKGDVMKETDLPKGASPAQFAACSLRLSDE